MASPGSSAPAYDPASDTRSGERLKMAATQLEARDITDARVLRVMRQVPRHEFIPEGERGFAYADHPVPIGHGQTISQPYIVALMTQAVAAQPGQKILEIGTGSGYQAAVLADISAKVYTVEIVPELAERAAWTLARLGYTNVSARAGDGYDGWPEAAPFDAVMVTAAANHVPPPLLAQLGEGGRLIIPLGPTTSFQTLTLITKRGEAYDTESLTGVRFVPLTGKALEKEE